MKWVIAELRKGVWTRLEHPEFKSEARAGAWIKAQAEPERFEPRELEDGVGEPEKGN